jgi:hypothetical protein
MTAEELVAALYQAFGYTRDNNRDLLGDELFNAWQVYEELEVEKSYQFLIAFIQRNQVMIEANLQDD